MKKITLFIAATCIFGCQKKPQSASILEGKVERDQLAVVSKLPGKIQQVLIHEGDVISAGDTLIILEFPEVEAKKEQAMGALNSAEAQYQMAKKGATSGQITQLRAKVAGLKEQMDFAEKSSRRLNNLLRDSLVPQQKYDEVFAKYQGAKNQYIAAVAELNEVSDGARIEQQTMALGQQERAMGAVNEVRVAEKERYILAPQDMAIENISLKVGELALPGYSLVSGFLNNTTYFRFTIPEKELSKVEKGKIITLQVPYAKTTLKGKIIWIKPLSSYANITSAYPDFEQQETLFEMKVVPVDHKEANRLMLKSTVTLDLDHLN